jgi:hypothetical protein
VGKLIVTENKKIKLILDRIIPISPQVIPLYLHIRNEKLKGPQQQKNKLEKKYAPALDNYGQSCFVRSDFLKMKCVCKTQMMPPPDQKKL